MKNEELKKLWQSEEDCAFIRGWDFSHIHGRYAEEEDLPWDYKALVREVLTDDTELLDYDTGGGEFLLSLMHPYHRTAATEGENSRIRGTNKDRFFPAVIMRTGTRCSLRTSIV